MKLSIPRNFKSIRQCEIDLPDFTVLTGLNGSGKTQILEGIAGNNNTISGGSIYSVSTEKFILLKDGENSLLDIKYLPNFLLKADEASLGLTVEQLWQHYSRTVMGNNLFNDSLLGVYNSVSMRSGKDVNSLSREDFESHLNPNDLHYPSDVFAQNFSALINDYIRIYEENEYGRFKISQGHKYPANKVLEPDQFKMRYNEKPWEVLNQILEKAQLDFYVESPEFKQYSRDNGYSLVFKKKNGDVINLAGLSSGERVMMALVYALYNGNSSFKFPQVLLLDEPDASLHPAMSKQLIEVLLDLFVKSKGVKVVITTHSPTTVALCPEESLYVVNKEGSQIEKISKDKALQFLTKDVPTLSIDYKGHRQVIVESPTDEYYYRTIYGTLFHANNISRKLYFISSGGYGKGNCDNVVKICTDFRNAGNETVFGIIDWDKTNKSDDHVRVHGQGSRYNVENYLFDPIYLICLFMKNNDENVRRDLSFSESFNEYSIGQQKDQVISDCIEWFFNKLYSSTHFRQYKNSNEYRIVEYFNGKKYELPVWYLDWNGHDLASKLKIVFRSLSNHKYDNEGKLQEDLSIVIGKCYPFIPLDTVLTFQYFSE